MESIYDGKCDGKQVRSITMGISISSSITLWSERRGNDALTSHHLRVTSMFAKLTGSTRRDTLRL